MLVVSIEMADAAMNEAIVAAVSMVVEEEEERAEVMAIMSTSTMMEVQEEATKMVEEKGRRRPRTVIPIPPRWRAIGAGSVLPIMSFRNRIRMIMRRMEVLEEVE